MGIAAVPAAATPPQHVPDGTANGVGAMPVDASISRMPVPVFPAAVKSGSGCSFRAVVAPNGRVIKHVAPCGSVSGTGSPNAPWRTIAQAMASLQPGDVAYVHDDPTLPIDYRESDLRPARNGSGASARIRLMAAPGERPWLAKSSSAASITPLLHLNRSWWVLDGLNLDATGLSLNTAVLRIGDARATAVHHNVVRRLTTRHTGGTKAVVEFDGAENSALLDSRGRVGTGAPLGLLEPLGKDRRPVGVPGPGSKDFDDHHAVTAKNGADRILVQNVESAGHNGDSFQCGEEAKGTTRPVTSNITLIGNHFHHDEENAIDLKACHGVTVRDNSLIGYRPARPYTEDKELTGRSPHGDAVVMHDAESGRAADRVLVELNRFSDNSRAVNASSAVGRVVVRRNLISAASAAACGIGAGLHISAADAEIYQNTLEGLRPPTTPTAACGKEFAWSGSALAAIRLAGSTSRAVLWNNIVSNARVPYAQSGDLDVDARRNLFDARFRSMPPNSLVGDPKFIADPAKNGYFTRRGSLARDAAAALPSAVRDPRLYCDDPSATESDTLIEPDVGFLESCS
jgi:hypothetical protein